MRPPEFWSKDDAASRAVAAALLPFGWLYGASVAWKRDHTTPYRSKAKVICVGNLTAGGSGKTPVAIAIGRALQAHGIRVAFLTRGYGGRTADPVAIDKATHGADDVGDEPLLLAEAAPTIVARDRKAGASLADSLGSDVIIMDDGHQNFTLEKDLAIVVIDAESGFGNGRVLPAGPLREPIAQGLARADAIVLMGDGAPDLPAFHGSSLRARLAPALGSLANRRVVAFAGIGRPAKFYATLKSLRADIVATHDFADHHRYTAIELDRLKAEATGRNANLLTTEKDYVRLSAQERAGIEALPVRAIFASPDELERLLDRIVRQVQARA
jgi:tetraacyldisaccharide 4'-kinase